MRKFIIATSTLLFYLLPLFSAAQNFGGNPAFLKWKQLNSKETRIIYAAGLDSQARRMHQLNNLLNNKTLYALGPKKRKWNIVLQNQTIISNAYVRMAPVMSELYLTPGQDNFSTGSLRWDDNLIIHENRHIQQLSNFNNGLTKVFSLLLGQEGQLLANGITIPDYFFEGDAVWQETLVSQQGRGRMPSFYNGIKSLWLQDKQYSWMKLRSGSLKHYLPDYYELGYMMVGYGYEKYGEDFWHKVTSDAVNFKGLFYAFNRAIEKYSGKNYTQFRNDALQYYKEKTLAASPAKEQNNYITPVRHNNVLYYSFPAVVSSDTLLVSKSSYRQINSFYLLINGKEKKLRVKDYGIDDYFSYRNGKIVYSAYRSDPLRANRDFNEIRLLDIYTNKQIRLTVKTKYFSPDINEAGTEIIAVTINTNGSNALHILDAASGKLIKELPNPDNYFYTQTKYISGNEVVSAVRHPDGRMALLKTDFKTGTATALTPFTYNVLGYPFIKNDTVYFSMMQGQADKIFAVDIKSKKNYQLTNNVNGMYQPVINDRGEMLVSSFTADGNRLQKISASALLWKEQEANNEITGIPFTNTAMAGMLSKASLADSLMTASRYRKSFRLFNFHSARPVITDTEYGYTFYGDNVLSSFSNNISYLYNRNERSSSIEYNAVFAGAFPFFTAGLEYNYNRNIDTALNKGINFNSAKAKIGFYVPLAFTGGRTFKFLNISGGYNLEQLPYLTIGKKVLQNTSFKYANTFISLSNRSRQARQHINPHWAQAITLNYRQGFNYFKTKKLVVNSSFIFPGLFTNHSLVLNGAVQFRDTLPDFFSNSFSYARGYEALNTRRMLKLGVNYHLPLLYPDFGFGNILFIQRIRANAFFDYNISRARLRGTLTDIINRSAGSEIYFDGKLWNALNAGIGIRYSHLLDTDLRNPSAKNRWEIILPINIIPN